MLVSGTIVVWPQEAQGSLTLRCEDGSIIGAGILSEDAELNPDGITAAKVTRELRGWVVSAS